MLIRHGRAVIPTLATLLAIATLFVACADGDATTTPPASASPTPMGAAEALAIYRSIATEVAEIRGLDVPERADPRIIDAEQLRANLEAEFDKANPAEQIVIEERMLKALGLLKGDASLRALLLDFQGSQVIGYYDPAVDELYVVSRSGALGPTERATYAHEFTHQLQDARFDLESFGLEEATDEGDRALATLGLIEGDAVSAQTSWMVARLTPAELGQIAAEAADPAILAVIGRTPAILLETALFPYQAGGALAQSLLATGGYAAVDAAYASPPVSTEQVIHPEKFATREPPMGVALPGDLAARFGSRWRLDGQDTLGELQLRVWLREGGVAGDIARLASEGWGGDRLGLLSAPDGAGDLVIIVTEWDSTADAAEFARAAGEAIARHGGDVAPLVNGRRVVVAMGYPGPSLARFALILENLAGE